GESGNAGQKFNLIDKTNDSHVDWRPKRAAHGGHGGETVGHDQHAVAYPGIHRVQRHNGVTAIRAVQVQRLNQQDFASLVAGVLLGGRHVSRHARDQLDWPSPRRCTESTMPTTVASVGGSWGRNGKLASLLRTQ